MTAAAELIAEFRSLAQSLEPVAAEMVHSTLNYIVYKHAIMSVGIVVLSVLSAWAAWWLIKKGMESHKKDPLGLGDFCIIPGALCAILFALLVCVTLPQNLLPVFEPLGALIASRL